MECDLKEADQQALDQRLKPYLERIEHLEHSCQRKEIEVVVLRLAFENIINQLADIKDSITKSKSKVIRPQTIKSAVADRR